jgi:hypothetical protein
MPRFVLLEHHWNGVHWDFMLERPDGASLRTWAIDAEVVPGVDLPARNLAEHRTAYLDYEGEVSGGRGVVRRVDRGDYEVLIWELDRVRVRLAGSQLVGLVEIRTTGTGGVGTEPVAEAGSSPGVVLNETPLPGRAWILRLGNFD